MTAKPLRLRTLRGAPLAVQLLLTFTALVAGTTALLTYSAYQTSLTNLGDNVERRVAGAADARTRMLTQVLALRQERANGFLESAQSLCAEPADSHRFGWSEACLGIVVKEFRLTEHATGALVTYRGRTLASAGAPVQELFPAPGAIARVVRRADKGADFLLRAVRDDAVLTVTFDSADIIPLFTDHSDLGPLGEVLLLDPDGQPLTPVRFVAEGVSPVGIDLTEPMALCLGRSKTLLDLDYRGVQTFHGFRPVAAIGGGCVDAHVPYDDAMASATTLRDDIVVNGVEFTVVGALISVLLAQRMAAPVRRLVASARELQAGAFDAAVPVAGPLEVRSLARALSAMAADLAQLVRREQAARRQAEAANRSKDQFLAMLSHELRTPLNAVLGWTRLLQTEPGDPGRVMRAAVAIERGAHSQQRLIEDLLDVSRIVAGKLRLVQSATRFSSVVEAALDAVRPQAREKGVELALTIDDATLLVLADPQRLQQVVWNLAWNAVKFTPSGGRVHVHLKRVGTKAELAVSDTGIGIEPDVLPHVFEWFRQADADSGASDVGLGLGLGLVRQLVDLHGGSVRAESEGPGRGSTFIVTMPTTSEDAASVETAKTAATETPASLTGLHVLCVDDDFESREVVRAVLQQAGADVRTAENAAAARKEMSTQAPDILIVDIAMPFEDGYRFMQSLRAASVRLPAVALTAFARREDAERARAAGFQVHMTKPVDGERLISTVAALRDRAS